MATYKFSKDGETLKLVSSTGQWSLALTKKKGHVHVRIKGPNKFRKQCLTSVTDKLTAFEQKAVLLHIYKLARKNQERDIEILNYASVFGSCFE